MEAKDGNDPAELLFFFWNDDSSCLFSASGGGGGPRCSSSAWLGPHSMVLAMPLLLPNKVNFPTRVSRYKFIHEGAFFARRPASSKGRARQDMSASEIIACSPSLCSSFRFLLFFLSCTARSNDVHRHMERSTKTRRSIDMSIEQEQRPPPRPPPPPRRIVIAGAGIIGTSTAYYLAQNHNNISSITLIDVTGEIAPAASGKAGGFLVLDWNDNTPTGPLTRRSFALHQELANRFGADTVQYRRLSCAEITLSSSSSRGGKKKNAAPLPAIEWASTTAGTTKIRSLGDESSIAQVHPRLLAQALWKNTPGGILRKGRVVGESFDPDTGILKGAVLADGTIVAADVLIYCCGPWSANVVLGVKYHSVIVPTTRVLSQAVFFQGHHGDPEVYVRPDQTAYCTGFPDPAITVTELPGQEQVRPDRIQTILQAVQACSGGSSCDDLLLDQNDAHITQACYLPTTDDGLPIMGQLGDNIYIATGHSCWGILLGPATGEWMASLVAATTGNNSTMSSTSTINLDAFSPQRYPHMILVPQPTTTTNNL
jgi:glycine/D-amino acid oxidase-like deaminating enzyme